MKIFQVVWNLASNRQLYWWSREGGGRGGGNVPVLSVVNLELWVLPVINHSPIFSSLVIPGWWMIVSSSSPTRRNSRHSNSPEDNLLPLLPGPGSLLLLGEIARVGGHCDFFSPGWGQNLLKVLTCLESSEYAILALKPRKLAISQMQEGFVTGAAASCEAPTQLQSSLFVLFQFPYFTRESSSLWQLHVVNKRSCLNAKYQVWLPLHPLGPETGPTFWGSSL